MKIRNFLRKPYRLLLILTIFAGVLVADVILWGGHISALTPYGISDGNEIVCCVRGRTAARDVLSNVITDLTKKNSNISAVSSDYTVVRAPGEKVVSLEEAYDEVMQSLSDSDGEIRVVSTTTENVTYTPDPDYEKNTLKLAGDTEILSEGSDGEKKVAATYTTVNGETSDKEAKDLEILQEGEPAVIEKGVLGLPKGEDWSTYDGDPVANSGEDIMTTAKQYIGLRYVWGGKSLETGVDCSGFVMAIYRLYGVNLNYPLENEGYGVSYSDAQPGDILYFPGHFGLYLGDGLMVHAANPSKGVCIGSVGGRKILAVRRIVHD